MRNPSRIYPFLNKIGDIWIKNSDLRFGQLIDDILGEKNDLFEIFYMEDEYLEKLIDKFSKKLNK